MTQETTRVVTLSGSPARHSRSAFLLRVAAKRLAASGIAEREVGSVFFSHGSLQIAVGKGIE
jgi:NAD(P)H-dependent FMN reductase